MNPNKYRKIFLTLAAGILLVVGFFLALHVPPVQATAGILYVSSTDPACGGQFPCYTDIQGAVDAASNGDIIKVARGVYTDVQTYAGISQVVYLNKNLTIRGGYTTSNWSTSDLDANTTTLDAHGMGRGLVAIGYITATLEGLHITGGDAASQGDVGGGIYVVSATVTISNCVVYSNTASSIFSGFGGGLYIKDGYATLFDNIVISNTASTAGSGNGGGMYFFNSTASLNDNVVQGNTGSTASIGTGGGLGLWNSTANLSGNWVQGNTASTAESSKSGRSLTLSVGAMQPSIIVINGEGGGLFIGGSTVTLNSNTIVSNTASTVVGGSGGGLSVWSSTARLERNTIQGNKAGTAEGPYSGGVGGGLELMYSTGTLNGNIVQSNTASTASDGNGGGLYLCQDDATLSGNKNIYNTAALAPTAAGSGGGLWILDSSSITLTNNLVAGNEANTVGSGLWVGGQAGYPVSGRMLYTTIADNDGGSGQGVYLGDFTTLVLTNTIISGHDSVGITFTVGSTASLEATLWYNNGVTTGGGGTVISNMNVYGDPAFTNPSARDYHLMAGSAAIDAGVNAGITLDIDGVRRPQGKGYDIGAYEYIPPIYLPIVVRNNYP